MGDAEYQAAVTAFIHAKGITRCPISGLSASAARICAPAMRRHLLPDAISVRCSAGLGAGAGPMAGNPCSTARNDRFSRAGTRSSNPASSSGESASP